MKTRITISLIAIVAFLATGSVALAQFSGQGTPTWYAVERGTASGGRYHLSSLSWQVSGAASGAGYRLLGPAAPSSSENGCCCTYLPCLLRNYP
jgi:hypothetical protein